MTSTSRPDAPIAGTLTEFFDTAVSRHGSRPALSHGEKRVTYTELGARRDRLAVALAAQGVAHGDRVALILPNCIEYVTAFFATVRLGAVVTQVNPMYTGRELAHVLGDSGARLALVSADAYPRLREIAPTTSLRTTVVVGEPAGSLAVGDLRFSDVMDGVDGSPDSVRVDPLCDLASLQYTGGTTGVSKGAMLTHANLLGAIEQTSRLLIEDERELPPGSAAVAVAPLFHVFGLTMVLLLGLRHGWHLLLISRFDIDELVALVRRERPLALAGVTTIFTALNGHPGIDDAGLDQVKLYISGGASVPAGLARDFQRRTGRPIWEGYGMSEGAPLTFNTVFRGPRAGSVGVPVPGTSVRIVDAETGRHELPPGQPGELIVRGPQVMQGYWGMPQESASTLRGGWLHTGDIAIMSDDGYLSIVDRKKDMINASGFKVYPREVEEVLYEHPDVREAVVVGVPDSYRGEDVRAFVVRRPGGQAGAEDLVAHCRQFLAAYKVPRRIEFRESLPKSTVGKLLRRALRDEEKPASAVSLTTAAERPSERAGQLGPGVQS